MEILKQLRRRAREYGMWIRRTGTNDDGAPTYGFYLPQIGTYWQGVYGALSFTVDELDDQLDRWDSQDD